MATPVLTNVNYRPTGPDNGFQRFNLYLPSGVFPPVSGWACIILLNLSDFDSATAIPATVTGFKEELIKAGFVLVDAKVTPSGSGAGLGLFRDDSEANWGVDDSMEFDAMSVVQYVREQVVLGTDEYENINVNRLILWGEASSGQVAQWVAFNKDLADPGSPTDQLKRSSRVFALVTRRGPSWFPAYSHATSQVKFRDSVSPAVAAATYGDATDTDKDNASPITKLLLSTSLEANRVLPVMLRSLEGTGSFNSEELDANGLPTAENQGGITGDNATWFMRILAKILRSPFVSHLFHARETIWTTQGTDNLLVGADISLTGTDGVGGWSTEKRYTRAFLANHVALRSEDVFDVPIGWDADTETARAGLSADVGQGAWFRRQGSNNAGRDGEARLRRWRLGHRHATAVHVARVRTLWAAKGRAGRMEVPMPDAPGFMLASFAGVPSFARNTAVDYEWEAEFEEVA